MKCLKCEISYDYPCIRELIRHLKLVHNVANGDNIKCVADGCGQYFNRLYNFIRHYERFHDDNTISAYSSNSDDINVGNSEEIVNSPIENSNICVAQTENINVNDLAWDVCSQIMTQNNVTYASALGFLGVASNLLKHAANFLEQSIQNSGIHLPSDVNNDFEKVKNLLTPFNTMYKFKQQFEKSEFFIKPIENELGKRFEQRFVKGSVHQVQVKDTYQYIPIVEVLKALFNRHDIVSEIRNYKNLEREPGLLSNIQDGQYYKKHSMFSSNNNTIALEFYIDDCEFNNPLSSHAGVHKLGLVYFTIKDFPPKFNSQISNIFLSNIHYAIDVDKYGYVKILNLLITDLRQLSTKGIDVVINAEKYNFKFLVWQFVGDNLALHKLFGLAGSFSANYYCRFCFQFKSKCQVDSIEKSDTLRNKDLYKQHIAQLESGDITQTECGIKSNCCLNKLEYWHVTGNLTVDCMHDIFEGWGSLELRCVVKQLIDDGLFTLVSLNARIRSFNYGVYDIKNRPSPITRDQLNNLNGPTGQNASQMWCLMRFLPLIIGDKIDDDNIYWKFYLLILDILDIVLAPQITILETFMLTEKIKDHHKLFLHLFPISKIPLIPRKLTPKQHHLVHYPRVIRQLGPPIRYWSMRYESNHYPFKKIAGVSSNFKNIAKTLANRNQLVLSQQLKKKNWFSKNIDITNEDLTKFSNVPYAQTFSEKVETFPDDTSIVLSKSITMNGITYKVGTWVFLENNELPHFGYIIEIFSIEKRSFLVCYTYDTLYYCEKFHSYVVKECRPKQMAFCLPDDLFSYHPVIARHSYVRGDNNLYITLKSQICTTYNC